MRLKFNTGSVKHLKGIPTASIQTHFQRGDFGTAGAPISQVICDVVVIDTFDVQRPVLGLRMSPAEARSYAQVLLDMADMAEKATS